MPPLQEELLKALHATGKPVVFINCSGSAIAMPWAAEHVPAIVQAWYPGEEGGRAVAEVLFGNTNPAGRLPVTFYAATTDLPAFDDYAMANRTYRYFRGRPLFAFGHGLSYTRFEYSDAKAGAGSVGDDGTIKLAFTVKNSGQRDGDEVAQVYFRHVKPTASNPQRALCAFTRVHLAAGASSQMALDIPEARLRSWDDEHKGYHVEQGDYELMIGGASDDIRLTAKVGVHQAGG
jgi:beta-glucosidase